MKTPLRLVCVVAAGLLAASVGLAQNPAPKVDIPPASPSSKVTQRVGQTDIEISYSRPSMKGRRIFGQLEPFGEMWRAGANNATTVSFSTAVKFGGTDVPAGTYAMFALLDPTEWTVILSKNTKQWGSYTYDTKDDVARAKVAVAKLTEPVETFTIDVNDIRDDSATLNLRWENTRVAVPLKFDVVPGVVAQIDAALQSGAKLSAGFYDRAAMFYLENGLDLKKAAGWMDTALAQQPDAFYMQYHKARLLAKLGDKDGAKAAAAKSIELASKQTGAIKDEYTRLNRMVLESLGQ